MNAAALLPALNALDTLPANIQAVILGEAAKLWAAHFAAEYEADLEAKRNALGAHSATHVVMPRGPKYHGGKCACGKSLPKWKCLAHFNTVSRKLVCSECYEAEYSRLFALAFPAGSYREGC